MDEVMQEALGLKTGQFVAIMGDLEPTPEDEVLARVSNGAKIPQ